MGKKIDTFQENGITYYQLYMACPVDYSGSIVAPRSFWTHGDDNCCGDVYVGDNAFYKCKKCGRSAHVMKCRYSCPVHSATPDELVFFDGATGCVAGINVAGQMCEVAGIPWFQRFLENLHRFENSAERQGA